MSDRPSTRGCEEELAHVRSILEGMLTDGNQQAEAVVALLRAFKGAIGCGDPVKVDFRGGSRGTVTARCMTDSLLKCPKCQALLDLARVTPGSPQLLGVTAKLINARKPDAPAPQREELNDA